MAGMVPRECDTVQYSMYEKVILRVKADCTWIARVSLAGSTQRRRGGSAAHRRRADRLTRHDDLRGE